MKRLAILITGLIAGTLDATAAIIQFRINGGSNPLAIARFIASGVFGSDAFRGGAGMVITGILLHYAIAIAWTALFFVAYPRVVRIIPNKYVSGILYGVLIWLVMNLVILPLSSVPTAGRDLLQDAIGMFILIVAVGLPISLIHHKWNKSVVREI